VRLLNTSQVTQKLVTYTKYTFSIQFLSSSCYEITWSISHKFNHSGGAGAARLMPYGQITIGFPDRAVPRDLKLSARPQAWP
jgi:hypothetical protein